MREATLIVTFAFGSADFAESPDVLAFELVHAAASNPAATTTAVTVAFLRALNDFIVSPGLMDRGWFEQVIDLG
jgi:hypothetical protein